MNRNERPDEDQAGLDKEEVEASEWNVKICFWKKKAV